MQTIYCEKNYDGITSLYAYSRKNKIKTFRRLKMFGLTWHVLWPFYLLQRKQILIFLVFIISLSLMLNNVFIVENRYVQIFYFISTFVILPLLSDYLLIRKRKMKNIKKSFTVGVLETTVDDGAIDIDGEEIITTKILIKILDPKFDINSDNQCDESKYDIVYNLDKLDRVRLRSIGEEIYENKYKSIYLDVEFNGKLQKHFSVRSFYKKSDFFIVKVYKCVNYTLKATLKGEVLRSITWRKNLNDDSDILYCNFDNEQEYEHFLLFNVRNSNIPTMLFDSIADILSGSS